MGRLGGQTTVGCCVVEMVHVCPSAVEAAFEDGRAEIFICSDHHKVVICFKKGQGGFLEGQEVCGGWTGDKGALHHSDEVRNSRANVGWDMVGGGFSGRGEIKAGTWRGDSACHDCAPVEVSAEPVEIDIVGTGGVFLSKTELQA